MRRNTMAYINIVCPNCGHETTEWQTVSAARGEERLTICGDGLESDPDSGCNATLRYDNHENGTPFEAETSITNDRVFIDA